MPATFVRRLHRRPRRRLAVLLALAWVGMPGGGSAQLAPVGAADAPSNSRACGRPLRLHVLPTAEVPCRLGWVVEVGQTTTIGRGAAEGGGGSGNQTYMVRSDLGIHPGVSLFYLFENNDDPTWDRVRGVRYAKDIFFMGGGGRVQLMDRGRTRVATEVSVGYLGIRSDPGLFTDDPGYEWSEHLIGSVGATVDRELHPHWTATLNATATFLPETSGGRPFMGRAGILGAGLRGQLHPRWTVFGTGGLVFGPGDNHLDREGDFRKIPLASAGLIYAVNPQLRITAYATNQTGATAPLRHLTLVGSVPVEAGLRLQWEPTAALAPGVPSRMFRGQVRVTADQRDSRSILATVNMARDLDVDLGVSWTPGLLVRERFGLRIGEEANYRLGGTVRLLRLDEGWPLDLDGRVTVGKSVETSQGYLVAELTGSGVQGGIEWSAGGVMALNGGETPMGVELEVARSLGRGARIFVRPLVLLTPHTTPWTAGLLSPALGAFQLEAFVTSAQSPLGFGRFTAVPGEPRLGVALYTRW